MSARNALFIPGPTNMPEAVRRAMDIPLEDQRAPDFPAFSLGLFRDLKKVFKTTEGQVFLFPGSGTGGWEAALTNTLSPGDRVLAARFGQFSHLWIEMCRRLGFEVEVIEGEWGRGAGPRPMPRGSPPIPHIASRRFCSATTRRRPA